VLLTLRTLRRGVSVPVEHHNFYSRIKGHLFEILGLLLLLIAAYKVLKAELPTFPWPF
jgi:hypothetical protein